VRRRRAALVALALVAPGCGRERIDVPDTTRPAAPLGQAPQAFPEAGVVLERPGNWPFHEGRPPLVASASSGTATVALWRYERGEALPGGRDALDAALTALEQSVKGRDGTFALEKGRRVAIDGAPAIQILGTESVDGEKRRVRSTHVYAQGAEVVLDAYAPEAEFARVDRDVFAPILSSMRIDRPQG